MKSHYKMMKAGFAAALAFTLTACESTSSTSTASASSQSTSSATTASDTGYTAAGDLTSYTIGTLGPRSGSTAVYGTAVTNAAMLAVKDWNAEHGTSITVATDYMDTTGDATQAVSLYNRLVSDVKVAAIIGPTLSGEGIAVAGASADTGVPIVSPSATAAAFTDEAGSNVFRTCYTDPQQATEMADFAYDTMGLRSAAIIYNADDDYSTGLAESFTAEFEAKGGQVLASESFGSSDSDFNAQLTNIAAQDIDCLFIPNYYEKDTMICEQARALGITAQFLGCDGWDGVLTTTTDVSTLEGAVFVNQYSPDMESVQSIMAEYQEEYGEDINSFGINSYDATMLVLEAIEKAGSLKASDICAAIASSTHDGILGEISFDENGDPIKEPIMVTIQNGEYVRYQ